ncbi:hypothetical protein Avbf_12291 [Armadillidium vulgare]|nr:hypothetical protein Avbf_12291 [Armadillidium vulgare]
MAYIDSEISIYYGLLILAFSGTELNIKTTIEISLHLYTKIKLSLIRSPTTTNIVVDKFLPVDLIDYNK